MRRARKKVDGLFFVWSVWSGNKFSLHLGLCFFNGKNVIIELYFSELRCMGLQYHYVKTTLWCYALSCKTWRVWFAEAIFDFSRFKFNNENKKLNRTKKAFPRCNIVTDNFWHVYSVLIIHVVTSCLFRHSPHRLCLPYGITSFTWKWHNDTFAVLHTLVAQFMWA